MTVMPTISDLLDAGTTATARQRWSIPCHEGDPELWFAETPAGVEEAKAACLACPLQAECLDGAVSRAEPWGVWGGQLFEHGVIVPRKRPRGRPRKTEVA